MVRGRFRPEPDIDHQITHVEEYQQHAGDQRTDEQVTHRHRFGTEYTHVQLSLLVGAGENIPQQHQRDRRWDNLAQRPGGADHTGGQARVVAAIEHRGQRQQPHGDHCGTDDARTGREQRANDHDRDC